MEPVRWRIYNAFALAAPDNYFLTYTLPTFNDTEIEGRRGLRA